MKLPNGYGSIQKLSGNRRKPYRVVKTIGWDNEGKQIRKTVGYYETRTKALQELALFNEKPYDIDTRNITVEELHKRWMKEHYSKVSYRTTKAYDLCWKYCISIKDLPFIDIKLSHLQTIVDSMGDKWSVKRNFKILWHQMYEYAIKNDIDVKKYSEYIDIGKRIPRIVRKPFEEEEIEKMWNNINNMDFIDIILILIYTGMRIGELLEIKIENVYIEKKYMIGGLKTEAGKNRVIPFHNRIIPLIIKRYNYAKENNSEYLLCNTKHKKMDYWTFYHEKWEKVLEHLEFDSSHTPHDTRHTFATRMDRTPANKLCIKRILGHASKDITEKVYTHKDIEELLEAVNCLK